MMDAATRIDVREQELNALIARRHDKRIKEEGENSEASIAAAWAESCDKYNAARQRELAWQWLRYHQGMLRSHKHTLALLMEHHRAEISKYEKMLGISHNGEVA
jgi:hypothetical protein